MEWMVQIGCPIHSARCLEDEPRSGRKRYISFLKGRWGTLGAAPSGLRLEPGATREQERMFGFAEFCHDTVEEEGLVGDL